MKAPWMPMYWPNYLADTMHFTAVEHGAYLMLIAHYWCNGGLPDDDAKLARIAKVSRQQWVAVRKVLVLKFDEHWHHKRIEHELAKALKLQESGHKKHRRWTDKRRSHNQSLPSHTNTNTNKDSKSQNGKLAGTGQADFVASPASPEFKKWKAWAYEQPSKAFWRELQQREIEGRPFNFETQWPPH